MKPGRTMALLGMPWACFFQKAHFLGPPFFAPRGHQKNPRRPSKILVLVVLLVQKTLGNPKDFSRSEPCDLQSFSMFFFVFFPGRVFEVGLFISFCFLGGVFEVGSL